MRYQNILKHFTLGLALLLAISSLTYVNASVSAFGGRITDEKVEKGSELTFIGSIANTNSSTVYIQVLVVLFVEDLGQSATRDPQEFDTVQDYGENGEILPSNATFTDYMIFNVDYEIGKYDVSIYFQVSDTATAPEESWDSTFALSNATIEIVGTSESLQIAKIIGYVIGGLFVLLVGLLIFNKIVRKS